MTGTEAPKPNDQLRSKERGGIAHTLRDGIVGSLQKTSEWLTALHKKAFDGSRGGVLIEPVCFETTKAFYKISEVTKPFGQAPSVGSYASFLLTRYRIGEDGEMNEKDEQILEFKYDTLGGGGGFAYYRLGLPTLKNSKKAEEAILTNFPEFFKQSDDGQHQENPAQ